MWLFIITFVLVLTKIYSWCPDGSITDTSRVYEVDFSPNGNYLAAGLENHMANLYYTANKTKKCGYDAGTRPRSIKFFPTNDKFAYGG